MGNGRKITEGLQEAVAYARGERTGTKITVVHVPTSIDVRALRERLGMTQEQFALQFGFSLGTVRNWEQGCRYPVGSARVLLKVIEHDPDGVVAALNVA